jgi:hypothetical protein
VGGTVVAGDDDTRLLDVDDAAPFLLHLHPEEEGEAEPLVRYGLSEPILLPKQLPMAAGTQSRWMDGA